MLVTSAASATLVAAFIACTAVGNSFVIAAICVDKSLRANSQNHLVLSLAFADLLVALLVMPMSAVYLLSGDWPLGVVLCDVWTAADVFCCTASILNLLAIAVDRYFAVTRVDYIFKRTRARISAMVALAWTVAALVSLAPMLGWKDAQFAHRVLVERKCLVSQQVSYQIFATASTFYAPLVVLLLLYWRIFKVARARIQLKATRRTLPPLDAAAAAALNSAAVAAAAAKRRRTIQSSPASSNSNSIDMKRKFRAIGKLVSFVQTSQSGASLAVNDDDDDVEQSTSAASRQPPALVELVAQQLRAETYKSDDNSVDKSSAFGPPKVLAEQQKAPQSSVEFGGRTSMQARREKKAAKILALVSGAFVLCWLPFFVNALAMPLCKCAPSERVQFALLWLGYSNSLLNPVIYTVFAPDFRRAFGRLPRQACGC